MENHMKDELHQFFDRLEEKQNTDERNFVEQLYDDVLHAFETASEGSSERIHLSTDKDQASITFRLHDEEHIAEYELFTVYIDGTIGVEFTIESEDYHRDTLEFEELESKPLFWFEEHYESIEDLEFEDFQTQYDDFMDALFGWMEDFCIAVTDALKAEEGGRNNQIGPQDRSFEPPQTEQEGPIDDRL